MEVKEIVHIVFATDENYLPYLGVTIYSLVKYSSSSNLYQIDILHTVEDIKLFHFKMKINSFLKENISIEFIDVSQIMGKWNIPTIRHLPKSTAYRLLIDKLFPHYPKALYLDSDIIILHDIAELYQINLNGKCLGASYGIIDKNLLSDIQATDPSLLNSYFNAGVLLIDISEFSSQKIGERALKLLENNRYNTQDQAALNILCRNSVQYIDGRWNVEWYCLQVNPSIAVIDENYKKKLKYADAPFIIHYTSHIKAWSRPDIPLARFFWDMAKGTPFYEEILFKNIVFAAVPKSPPDVFSRFVFPWHLIRPGTDIIVYGGGAVGKAYVSQLKKTGYANVSAICDQNPNNAAWADCPNISLEELARWDLSHIEKIVIAIQHENLADKIRNDLIELGMPMEKIVWKSPLK